MFRNSSFTCVLQIGTKSLKNLSNSLIKPNVLNGCSILHTRNKTWKSSFPPIDIVDHCIHTEIVSTIEKHIDNGHDYPALISAENPKHSYTYKKFVEVSEAVEHFLEDSGFKTGDVVTAILPNCIEYPPIFLATIGRSGIFSGASPHFQKYEIHRQLEDSKTKVVFTTEKHLDKVVQAAKKVASVQKVVCLRSSTNPLPEGIVDFTEIVKSSQKLTGPARGIEDVVLLPYSSGTTGVPKGVQLTHLSFLTVVRGIKRHFEEIVAPTIFPSLSNKELGKITKAPQIHFLPFYHAYGQAVLIKNILLGCPIHVMSKFDPILYLETVEAVKAWNLYVVPPVALMLAKDDRTKQFDLSSLRYVLSAGAPLGPELGDAFLAKYPNVTLVQAFGMSETSLFPFLPAMEGRKGYATVGKVSQDWEARIVGVEDGKELEENQTGEICVRGPGLMKGYLNRIAETTDTFDEEGWFHTGDIGYFDDHGELFIVDRMKELIKVKGLQVPPAELESVLAADDRIKDVAVIGVPHEKFGEVPKAFVIRNSNELTESDVKMIIAEKLAPYKRLEGGVEFLEEIPKSPSGKILRRELRNRK